MSHSTFKMTRLASVLAITMSHGALYAQSAPNCSVAPVRYYQTNLNGAYPQDTSKDALTNIATNNLLDEIAQSVAGDNGSLGKWIPQTPQTTEEIVPIQGTQDFADFITIKITAHASKDPTQLGYFEALVESPGSSCPSGFGMNANLTCSASAMVCPTPGSAVDAPCNSCSDGFASMDSLKIGDPIEVSRQFQSERLGLTQIAGFFPINLSTYYSSATVAEMPAISFRGFPSVQFSRASAYAQDTGPGWTVDYTSRLSMASSTSAYVSRPNGTAIWFSSNGSGQWTPVATGVNAQLTQQITSGQTSGWLLRIDDHFEHYDALGYLTQLVNPEGQWINIGLQSPPLPTNTPAGTTTHISFEWPVTVTHQSGRAISFQYGAVTASGLPTLTGFTDGNGHNITYQATSGIDPSNSNPTETDIFTWQDNTQRQYVFGEAMGIPHITQTDRYLTSIVDENGSTFAQFTYDTNGNAIQSQQAGSANSYSVSSTTNGTSTVTNPLGASVTRTFTTAGGRVHLTSETRSDGASYSLGYDANGNLASYLDVNGHLHCAAYDSTRNLKLYDVNGLPSGACPSPLSGYIPTAGTVTQKTTYQYHPQWSYVVAKAEPLKISYWIYNGQPDPTNGNTLASCAPSSAVLPDGNPIAVLCKHIEKATTDSNGANGLSATLTGLMRTWSYTYNAQGQVITETGPRGNLATSDPNYVADVTTYTYYPSASSDYWQGDLEMITDALGHTTHFLQYDGVGHVLLSQDMNGTKTEYNYNSRGWVTSIATTPILGAPGAPLPTITPTLQYGYDNAGQLIHVMNSDGAQMAFGYDGAHRLTSEIDSLANKSIRTLDGMGNVVNEKTYDINWTQKSNIDRVFDQWGRLTQVTGAKE